MNLRGILFRKVDLSRFLLSIFFIFNPLFYFICMYDLGRDLHMNSWEGFVLPYYVLMIWVGAYMGWMCCWFNFLEGEDKDYLTPVSYLAGVFLLFFYCFLRHEWYRYAD